MLRNYIKIVLRSLKQNKAYSIINIAGLAIGMAACILILLWVQDELSFDRYNEKASDIYRVYIQDDFPDGRSNAYGVTPGPLGETLKSDYPEVIDFVRLRYKPGAMLKFGENTFNERYFAFADPSIFNIFTFPLVKGDPQNALSDPRSIVINETMSKKYFGDSDPIGKVLSMDSRFDLTVKGVMKDIPENSSLKFSCFAHFKLVEAYDPRVNEWGSIGTITYVLLKKGAPHQELVEKIRGILKKKLPQSITELRLHPLTDIHLHSQSILGMGRVGEIRYVYIFSIIAAFVLLIACINFMNLTTARSGTRSREVGIRKVSGAYRRDLILQFFGESIFFSFVALILALVLVKLLLPTFNTLSGKVLTLDFVKSTGMILWLAAIAVFTGIVSGTYPSLYLSSFRPAVILKGTQTQKGGRRLRKGLVITQFTLSIILIIGTLLVYHQLNYMRNQDLGFDKEHLVYVTLPGGLIQKYDSIKNELLSIPDVLNVTAASDLPTSVSISTHGAQWEGKDPKEMVEIRILFVDHDYLKTLKMAMAKGRFFSRDFTTDAKEAFVLNEAAIKAMGMESPLGKWFEFNQRGKIVGVIKDFNFTSLHQTIQPLVMILSPQRLSSLIIRVKPENISATIDNLKAKWAKVAGGNPFKYGFVDESLDELYGAENRTGKIFLYFTLLSIFISCLGLFGLASFMAEQRTKEIAVRKVFGASGQSIVRLLLKEFTLWVILANVIAWPAAYFFMKKWLGNFAYRINIGIETFILSGILALVIALLTVSYQTIKAVNANPVDALKYE